MQRSAFLILVLSIVIFSCKKEKVSQPGSSYKIVVKNQAGEIQPGAEIYLFHSVEDLISNTNAYLSLQANAAGSVDLPESLADDTLIICARKSAATSEFTALKYTASEKTYQVSIQQPYDQQLLCGHGSKKWLMTSYTINGNPQAYVVTSTLNADGTWTDTNGNAGAWHFQNNNAQLVYDYTNTGMTVIFDVLELTSSFISLKGNQSGMIVEMEMTAVN